MDYFQFKSGIKNYLQNDGAVPKLLRAGVYGCAVPVLRMFRHMEVVLGMGMRELGIPSRKYEPLKKFKGIHKNERCFIVCTGPSLTVEDVNRLRGEYTFAMNSIFPLFDKTDWRPSYYCIVAADVYTHVCEDERFKKIENAFIPNQLVKQFDEITIKKYTLFPMETCQGEKRKGRKDPVKFSEDIYKIVYDAATVTYTIMQIAVYMGFKEIYLLGCDCDYRGARQHFEDVGLGAPDNVEDQMRISYYAAKMYADAHGIKIYNATRGGKLEVFERVDFDSLFMQ